MTAKVRFRLLPFALAAFSWQPLPAEEVSHAPPATYAQAIAPQLTPLEKILAGLPQPPQDAQDGWVLLSETIHYIMPDGKRLVADHLICKALTDAGAAEMARVTRPYVRTRQKMHLALARTIQPNGGRQDARPEACFLQSPQREADNALYHDAGELVFILPNVKAGSITEWIVVVEETKPRIPGHFTGALGFQWGWPCHRIRGIVDAPDAWADRITAISVGAGVPPRQPVEKGDGRTRLMWQRDGAGRFRPEPGRAPFLQTGPVVRLSTLKDWDELLAWYVPLAEQKTTLNDKLKADIDALTKGATQPREVLDRLAKAVADDVRYVGLEFGSSDLEPHPVAEVWDHQYGDCKDKASLLRAMLAHKGISSHMVLLNTEHLGLVERRSPGVMDFNHVILRVELPEGPVYCDPTLARAPAGMISPQDADRDALLVKQPQQWVRTPAADAGSSALDFDVKVAPNGELSGWATVRASGFLGTIYTDTALKSSREMLKEFMRTRIDRCYPGAQVADLKDGPASKSGDFELAAYFIVPPGGAMTLRFPVAPGSLIETGDAPYRETDMFLWRDHNSTTSTFTLPKGYRPASLPPPHDVDTPQVQAHAAWEHSGQSLKATLTFRIKQDRIPAADVQKLQQVTSGLASWMDRPLTLQAGLGIAYMPGDNEIAEMPVMPTGEGQLALVQQRYPLTGNLRLRRAGLERTMQLFPQDHATQFNAQVQLAYLDIAEGQADQALNRLRVPLETLRGHVPVEEAALGDYIMAVAYGEKGALKEALAIHDKIVADPQVSGFRRSWSQVQRGRLLMKDQPDKALEATMAGLALEDGEHAALYVLLAELRLRGNQSQKFEDELEATLRKSGPQTQSIIAALVNQAKAWAVTDAPLALLLLGSLEKPLEKTGMGGPFAAEIKTTRAQLSAGENQHSLQKALKEWVDANPAEIPPWQMPDSLKTLEDFERAVAQALTQTGTPDHAAQLVRLHLELLLRFPPGPSFSKHLAGAAIYADYLDRTDEKESPPRVFEKLLELCALSPEGSEAQMEGRFLTAELFTRQGKLEEAGRLLQAISEDPELMPAYRVTGYMRYSANCLARKQPADALASWKKLADYRDFDVVPAQLLTAVMVALETGRREEALAFLSRLRNLPKAKLEQSEAGEHLRTFLLFSSDLARAQAWWDASPKWWPAWLEFERKQMPCCRMASSCRPSFRTHPRWAWNWET